MHSRILVLNDSEYDVDNVFEQMSSYGNGVDYVTESELNKPYMLQLETDSIDEVREYLDDIDDTILVEKSIADEIGNYNCMIRIKNGEVKEVFDGLDLMEV